MEHPEKANYWSKVVVEISKMTKNEKTNEVLLFDALLERAKKRKDENSTWKSTIDYLIQNSETESIGETRNPVWTIKGGKFLKKTIIIKSNKNKKTLEHEIRTTKKLEDVLDNSAVLPNKLYLSEEPQINQKTTRDFYFYVMRVIEGETLYQKLQKNDKKSMPEIIETLAKIHARYPEQPRINLMKKLEDKLYNPEFKMKKNIADDILENYLPIAKELENTIWGWNKDAHPENWIIGEQIGIIDMEADHSIPVTFDLANLLEYENFFNAKEKKKYVTHYETMLNKEGKQIENIQKTYLNSVIYRMICLASAWSSPSRIKMHEKIPIAINNAITAIDTLSEQNKPKYQKIKKSLEQLKTTL